MGMNVNGCSVCPEDDERWEEFTARIGRKTVRRVQYDYRSITGELFSCVAGSIKEARERRNAWIMKRFSRRQQEALAAKQA